VTGSVSGNKTELTKVTLANLNSNDVVALNLSTTMSSDAELTQLGELRAQTGGKITGTVSAAIAKLKAGLATSLTTQSSDSITLSVTGVSGAAGIANFNALHNKTDKKITAAISATVVELASLNIDNFENDELAITVTGAAFDASVPAELALLNKLAAKSTGIITASITGTSAQLVGLATGPGDLIAVGASGTYSGTSGVAALNLLAGKTGGVVTATAAGTVAQLTGLTTAATDQITLSAAGNVTASDVSTLNSISAKTFDSYTLSDSVLNVNGHTTGTNSIDNLISRATNVTINETRSGDNTALKLGTAKTLGSTSTLNYTGTDAINIVELSHGLTANNTVTRTLDFVEKSGTTDGDQLVFNVDETNTKFASFDGNGDVVNGGISTFKFSTVNNFKLASAEDKFGVFYSGTNKSRTGDTLMTSFVEITASINNLAYKLTDGRVYEDELSGIHKKDKVVDSKYIKNNIASFIQSGGVAIDADDVGSAHMDFTYIIYGESQADISKTSAYVYAGRYAKSNVLGNTAIDSTKLHVAGITEITDVTRNEINGISSDSYLLTKHSNL
jgi:hypothetical protein